MRQTINWAKSNPLKSCPIPWREIVRKKATKKWSVPLQFIQILYCRIPEFDSRRIISQVLQALRIIHRNRFIHRDVKPENILLAGRKTVKLCDFGFARAMNRTGKPIALFFQGSADLPNMALNPSGVEEQWFHFHTSGRVPRATKFKIEIGLQHLAKRQLGSHFTFWSFGENCSTDCSILVRRTGKYKFSEPCGTVDFAQKGVCGV